MLLREVYRYGSNKPTYFHIRSYNLYPLMQVGYRFNCIGYRYKKTTVNMCSRFLMLSIIKNNNFILIKYNPYLGKGMSLSFGKSQRASKSATSLRHLGTTQPLCFKVNFVLLTHAPTWLSYFQVAGAMTANQTGTRGYTLHSLVSLLPVYYFKIPLYVFFCNKM